MAILHPFRALRPVPGLLAEVASVPYDVINTEEARALAEGKPLSFLHVIRPEIDLPVGTDEHADEVYKKGASNLEAYAQGDHSFQEEFPCVYIYRLIMNGRAQTGVFGCVAVEDYDNNVILKHEKTRPVKEDDRTRHILTQRAHAEPVMLTYRDDPQVTEVINATTALDPLYDFEASDGVQHTIWRVDQAAALVDAFSKVSNLYVADGHHRCKAASRAAEALRDTEEWSQEVGFFPAVMFPMSNMEIMAYNRIVSQLPSGAPRFLDTLSKKFPLRLNTGQSTPQKQGEICLYLNGEWHTATLPATSREGVAAHLDVARLNEHMLQPILGIMDVRTDPNVDFVGGIRGTKALEKLVESGKAELAISMYPTSIEELLVVSDAGLLMPPKSTWFEPKLRSGLLVHLFD